MDEEVLVRMKLTFAYYDDIVRIDMIYNARPTYTPYMLVVKTDSSKFKVRVDGEKAPGKSVFLKALFKSGKETKNGKA